MYNYTINNLPLNFNNYFVKSNTIHGHATRYSNMFRSATFKYDLARNTIRVQGPVLWNAIPNNIKSAPTLNNFKCKYKKYLISLY